jgi:hypothetical protein
MTAKQVFNTFYKHCRCYIATEELPCDYGIFKQACNLATCPLLKEARYGIWKIKRKKQP